MVVWRFTPGAECVRHTKLAHSGRTVHGGAPYTRNGSFGSLVNVILKDTLAPPLPFFLPLDAVEALVVEAYNQAAAAAAASTAEVSQSQS